MEEKNNNEYEINSEVKQTNRQQVQTKKKSKIIPILVLIIMILIIALALSIANMYAMTKDYDNIFAMLKNMRLESQDETEEQDTLLNEDENKDVDKLENSTLNLNFGLLKLENKKDNEGKNNKIYSPLSIKYALKMLEEGTTGNSKKQISKVIGNDTLTKYNSNSNMSLANALFVRDTFKNGIKESYINTLEIKYGAEVIFDSFSSANNVNNWISNKTLKLINNMLDSVEGKDFLLINALGIDLEWENKFLKPNGENVSYAHEEFWWSTYENVVSHSFMNNQQNVSGMEIAASINNYDIIKELGEENIKKIVGEEFKKWAKNLTEHDWEYDDIFKGDLSEENIEKKLKQYLDVGRYDSDYDSEGYISEIDRNYGRIDYSTDFSIYVDDSVKVFAKDLKEYEGTTLQYVGIMPTKENLENYIENIDETKINNIISNLKDLKTENFRDGVVTKITGYIPKFKFEYEVDLEEDLRQLGITDIFEQGKANINEICNQEDAYISDVLHKAKIEFTQDGIKAAAATVMGGAGAGDSFDYLFDVPVEEIDLTFDNPYMFLIRDKETGEIWFTGTVIEPLSWEEEPENQG